MNLEYDQFDLVIEPLDEHYCARVIESPAGQTSAVFKLPFSDLQVENFVLRLSRSKRLVRRVLSSELAVAKDFGGALFDAVLSGEVRSCFRTSVDQADRRGAGLRIRLRLTGAPQLADLPWEYLYDGTRAHFLSLSAQTPIVRYLDIPERIRPLQVVPPLEILTLIASPSGYPPLDVEREYQNLTQAMDPLIKKGLVVLNRLTEPTLAGLQRRLRQSACNIFHFIGHGGFDQKTQAGGLIFEDERSGSQHVDSMYLGTLLHDHRSLRMAVLNACGGTYGLRSDPFSGMAEGLVQQGIPAVIAMQFEISDEAAIVFSKGLYQAIADGYPVDAALAESRKAIFTSADETLEWGTPVLFMRAPDGRIFDTETSPRTKEADTSEVQSERISGFPPKERQPKVPIHLVDSSGRGDFATISAAVEAATAGDRIVVRPGLYDEELTLTKPLQIVGDGPLEEIVVQGGHATISFSAPTGKISNLTLRGGWYGVEITQGKLELEECDISAKMICVLVHAEADPQLRQNRIHGSNVGIQFENARGILEDNDIFTNRCGAFFSGTKGLTVRRNRIHDNDSDGIVLAGAGYSTWESNDIFDNKSDGITISKGSNPTLRLNRIYNNSRGIHAWDGGLGVLVDNQIFGNETGIEIMSESTHLTGRNNRIHDCESYGIEINSGRCTLENNEIFANGLAGVRIKKSRQSMMRRNRIHDNRYNAIWIDKEGGGTFQENDLRGSVDPWCLEGEAERFSRREGNLED